MTTTSFASTASAQASSSVRGSLSWWTFASLTVNHAFASWLLAILSPSGFYRFGRLFGTLEWLINHKRRRRFARALEQVLDHKPSAAQRRRATREFFMRSRCERLFYLTFDRMLKCDAVARFTISNRDLLDDALARGHGVHIALAHQGDHHALGMLLTNGGYPTAGVRDRSEGPLRRFVQERFARRYPEIPLPRILFAGAFPRELYRVLQEGNVLVSLLDVAHVRGEHQKMQTVQIFGEKREFVTGPLRIALRCKSPVLQAFFIPERDFRHRLDIVDMLLDPEVITDEESAVAQALDTYAANVERFLRERPELVSRI